MRRIILTPDEREKLLKEMDENLRQNRTNGTFTVTYKAKDEDLEEPISLNFMPEAWIKTFTLVTQFTTECAWHGLVTANDERTSFTVYDILVYPQVVTNATVNVDEEEYEKWHQNLNDIDYNNLRMQAHSHVKMGVSPSGTDKSTYEGLQQTISEDSYYIFMIFNKDGDIWTNIYDLKHNAIYDKSDIEITVAGVPVENWGFEGWYAIQKDNIKKKKTPIKAKTKTSTYFDRDQYISDRDDFYNSGKIW